MFINIAIAVLGAIVASTAELTTIFGEHETQIIVAAGGIALGVIAAINGVLHGYSPPIAGPLASAPPPKTVVVLAVLLFLPLLLVSSGAFGQAKHPPAPDPISLLKQQIEELNGKITHLATPAPIAVPTATDALSALRTLVNQVQNFIAQFTGADLDAAIANANAQNPPDTIGAACWTDLKGLLPPAIPEGAGLAYIIQVTRDFDLQLGKVYSDCVTVSPKLIAVIQSFDIQLKTFVQ
jgi:hypothetical protein